MSERECENCGSPWGSTPHIRCIACGHQPSPGECITTVSWLELVGEDDVMRLYCPECEESLGATTDCENCQASGRVDIRFKFKGEAA